MIKTYEGGVVCMAFREIDIKQLQLNPFKAIGDEWMLITAGDEKKVNTMTASWGGMGVLWGENVATVYIRPQRYTREFVDANGCFSLSFFDGYKKQLGVLGTVSGRDRDKIGDVDFHVTYLDGVPAFEEARLVLIAEKLYVDRIRPECFLDKSIDEKHYPGRDHHLVYIARIKKVYVRD